MIPPFHRYAIAALCLAFASCASQDNPYRPSFVEMARQAESGSSEEVMDAKSRISEKDGSSGNGTSTARGQSIETNRYAKLHFSDQLALNYANEMTNVLRPKFNRARQVRETSSAAQVALAGVASAAGPFHLSDATLAALGITSAGIPEFQRIFNAKGRAENYQTAVNMIEDAVTEYLSYNQNPSDKILTQNGVSLIHRTTAAIHVVEQSLAGILPTVQQMQQATERMSPEGASRTPAGSLAVNNVAANPRVEAALSRDVHTVETVLDARFGELQDALKSEQKKNVENVDFVSGMRKLDRDQTIGADQKKKLYDAILAEAGLTGKVEDDPSKIIGFFQVTADDNTRAALTKAINKHLSH